jgi:hypothetical protein
MGVWSIDFLRGVIYKWIAYVYLFLLIILMAVVCYQTIA